MPPCGAGQQKEWQLFGQADVRTTIWPNGRKTPAQFEKSQKQKARSVNTT